MTYQDAATLKNAGFSMGMLNQLRKLDVNVDEIASFSSDSRSSDSGTGSYHIGTSPIALVCSWLTAELASTFPEKYQTLKATCILDAHMDKVITFNSLVELCWDSGIPVIPMDKLKSAFRLPPFLVVWDGRRPVIFLSTEGECLSRNLYKLACALIVAEQHQTSLDVYVSKELPFSWGGFEHVFKRRAEINDIYIHDCAIKLLTRNQLINTENFASITLPGQLALECDLLGETLSIEPGILALLVADHFLSWDIVKDSLEYLDKPDERSILKNLFRDLIHRKPSTVANNGATAQFLMS